MKQHCRICKQKIIRFKIPAYAVICRNCHDTLLVPCKCGCGGMAFKYLYGGRKNIGYIAGHHSRTPQHKAKWKRNKPKQPMKGHKHSAKTKKKMSDGRRGSLNANWKGGLTEKTRGIRRSPKYFQWRKAVLERDNRICQRCGKPNARTVHHVKPVKTHPDLIFDIANGITVCGKCHMAIHRKEGRLCRQPV